MVYIYIDMVISRRKRYPRNLCSPPRSGSCRRERSTRACITEERKEKQRRRRRHNRRPINSVVGGLPSLLVNRNNNRGRGGSAWQPPSASRCEGEATRWEATPHPFDDATKSHGVVVGRGRTSEKHRHDTSSVPQAAGIVIYMRDTCNALCDFFSRRSPSLSRAYSRILSLPPRPNHR